MQYFLYIQPNKHILCLEPMHREHRGANSATRFAVVDKCFALRSHIVRALWRGRQVLEWGGGIQFRAARADILSESPS